MAGDMDRKGRSLVYAGAAGALLLLVGFFAFAGAAVRPPSPDRVVADGIVVLTGAERRIEAGLKLLRDGSGRRLLISGMNPRTSPGEVLRNASVDGRTARCCIDFGYQAQDTTGNAIETKAWAERNGFSRLLVVTSSYHMARGLTELAIALPGVELVAHPVVPRMLGDGAWWLRRQATRVLVAEYFKLLPAYARYAARQLLSPVATAQAPSPPRQPRAAAL
jgi:uncharacterized SAM-binding protein YcdF (DUF218 family)